MRDAAPLAGHPILGFARDEAIPLGHPFVGTEHVLLGLLRADDEEVNDTLAELGLTSEAVRAAVMDAVRPGNPLSADGRDTLPFTTRTKSVINLAAEMAGEAGTVKPMHFLQGILAEGENIALAVLAESLAHRMGLQARRGAEWRSAIAAEFKRVGLKWKRGPA